MDRFQEELQKKCNLYQNLINRCELFLSTAPEGELRVSGKGHVPNYYLRHNGKEKYIQKNNMELIKNLAQKKYCEQILKVASPRLRQFKLMSKNYSADELERVYDGLISKRKDLVNNYAVPFQEYAKEWQAKEYPMRTKFPSYAEIFTERGERVLSKSEKIIADKLWMLGIPYRYEYPLVISEKLTFHPDFTLLHPKTRTEWIWEHMGMMDDPDYSQNALHRINLYEQQGFFPGINMILTHETKNRVLDMRTVTKMLRAYEFIE